MPSCDIDSRQRLFRCSKKKFVSETCEKWLQEYFVSESRVHLGLDSNKQVNQSIVHLM